MNTRVGGASRLASLARRLSMTSSRCFSPSSRFSRSAVRSRISLAVIFASGPLVRSWEANGPLGWKPQNGWWWSSPSTPWAARDSQVRALAMQSAVPMKPAVTEAGRRPRQSLAWSSPDLGCRPPYAQRTGGNRST